MHRYTAFSTGAMSSLAVPGWESSRELVNSAIHEVTLQSLSATIREQVRHVTLCHLLSPRVVAFIIGVYS